MDGWEKPLLVGPHGPLSEPRGDRINGTLFTSGLDLLCLFPFHNSASLLSVNFSLGGAVMGVSRSVRGFGTILRHQDLSEELAARRAPLLPVCAVFVSYHLPTAFLSPTDEAALHCCWNTFVPFLVAPGFKKIQSYITSNHTKLNHIK